MEAQLHGRGLRLKRCVGGGECGGGERERKRRRGGVNKLVRVRGFQKSVDRFSLR